MLTLLPHTLTHTHTHTHVRYRDAKDVVKLPSWVNSVSLFRGGDSKFVGRDASNSSYLEDPAGGDAALGFVTKGGDGSQGTVVDINTTVGVKYNITMCAFLPRFPTFVRQ